MIRYEDAIPDSGVVLPLRTFLACVDGGGMTDADGHGYPVRDEKMSVDVVVKPSKVDKIPEDATHILWFETLRRRR